MAKTLPKPTPPAQDETRGVLAIPAFRKLWQSMAFSSFGDWLGLLATTALAQQLSGGDYKTANFAIAGVFIARLLPAVILGPLAGVIADRFDRRRLMVVADILRAGLYFSIPLFPHYWWLYTATILVECVTLFWSPAKEASVPNLVPKSQLESANQVSLLAAYGTAPIAAIVFTFLALLNAPIQALFPFLGANQTDIALYLNAVSFLYTAWIVFRMQEIPKGPADHQNHDSITRSLIDGGKFVGQNKIVRGLIVGMVGAFMAAGAVIGLARTFVGDLGGGDAAYGVLFSSVFGGLALGIAFGPRVLSQFSRRRLFGASLAMAGFFLVLLALINNLVIAVGIVVILGAFSGVSWVTGFTMLGMEVENEVRGRTFAYVQSLIRVTLVAVLAIAPLLAAWIGKHEIKFYSSVVEYNGAAITILFAGVLASVIGIVSYKQMKDRPGVSFFADVVAALRGDLSGSSHSTTKGIFIAFEGGEGSGKSTQAKLLAKYLKSEGYEVLLTHEPGGSDIGKELRKILLHTKKNVAPRAEALLYAADRAQHVEQVIRPALAAGKVVITDRYFDSSIAYQGAGRVLSQGEIGRISRWATEFLIPTLTVIVDVPAKVGLGRLKSKDRLESEPIAFHERVRQEFLSLAMLDPERYLVVDGRQTMSAIEKIIRSKVDEIKAKKQ